MLTALRLALSDAFLPEQRRAVLTSLCLALALLIALWLGATLLARAWRTRRGHRR